MFKKICLSMLVFMISLGMVTNEALAITNGRDRAAEKQLFQLTNADRPGSNLKLDPGLSRKAYRHSKWMANNGLIHTSSLSSAYMRGKIWSVVGENIGTTAVDDNAMVELEVAFKNSPPHWKNIKKPAFKKVGIGVYIKGNTYWVTVVFYG